ncbi:MAG: PilZ domain-containing protein [Magnetococcus sp. DMHC-8]
MVLFLDTSVQRRAYARADDLLPLAWRRVEPGEYAQVIEYFEKYQCLPRRPEDDVRQLLTVLTASHELAQLRQKQPDLTFVLEQLDAKLNLVLRLLHPTLVEHSLVPTRVTLSGSGMAFWVADPPPAVGDCLEVHVTLAVDALITVGFFVQVLRLDERDEEGRTPVACRFAPILDDHRDQVVRHVFKRQTELLRVQRGL